MGSPSSSVETQAPTAAAADAALVAILDDDPTGAQEAIETPVVVDWSEVVLQRLADRPFHVLTNTRAHSADEAYAITYDAASAVRRWFPDAHLVLRGDSTLRAHLREEYEAVRDAAFPGLTPTLLLVPALPAAGRVTVNGVHLLEREHVRAPLSETEYAHDGAFAYRSARLLDWAEERSSGLFSAARGAEVPLAKLRDCGGAAVQEALATCAAPDGPGVCAPDAETVTDLAAIADGLRAARADGLPVIVRCGPTFATVLCRTLAPELLPVPRARSLLIVCGSYVEQTTRQLTVLLEKHGEALVELNILRLLGNECVDEVERARRAARCLLARNRLAVVATPRMRSPVADDPAAASLITERMAMLTELLADEAELVLFKGGNTSAVCLRDGLGAQLATVEGPVMPGIALWRLENGLRCLVFPGNVGDDETLTRIVEEVLR